MSAIAKTLQIACAGALAFGCSLPADEVNGDGVDGGALDPAAVLYPDLETLHANAVAPTCSLNGGVCHSSKDYPELTNVRDVTALLAEPCQLAVPDPSLVIDACEVPGDRMVLGGIEYQIMLVRVTDDQPYPPKSVQIKLASVPHSLAFAEIRRASTANQSGFTRSLAGATVTAYGPEYPQWVIVGLASEADKSLADFLDPRAWYGDRVRMGDPNQDGIAHASAEHWAEVVPGHPEKSFLYQRLITDKYGATMPLIPRTWSAVATRAIWCWIRGLAPDATPANVDPSAPIDYANCPIDPAAPDPNASGGWPAIKTLVGSRCAQSSCHSPTAMQGDLDLTPDPATFAKYVINAPAMQEPGALIVVPGQVSSSYLDCKIDPACTSRAPNTGVMPVTGDPFTTAEIKLVSDWISSGAHTE